MEEITVCLRDQVDTEDNCSLPVRNESVEPGNEHSLNLFSSVSICQFQILHILSPSCIFDTEFMNFNYCLT